MKVLDVFLNEVKLIESPSSNDLRGAFIKLFDKTNSNLSSYDIQQVNFVNSYDQYTLRGLHFQTGTFGEAKFFRVTSGEAQLAFVDIRPESPFFLKSKSVILNKPEVGALIPSGFATGYLTLRKDTNVLYYSDNIYNSKAEKGIRWNDPLIQIDWKSEPVEISEKDKNWETWSGK